MANRITTRFERARIGGAELEYEAGGAGEPVLFIHGAIVGDAFGTMLSQPSLTGRYRLFNYHRRGFEGSSRATAPFSIEAQAADALALLDALDIERAHVAGHSYGGLIALQLAVDVPERVHSLALLEAGTLWCDRPAEAAEAIQPVLELYEAGDVDGAVTAFGQMVAGPDFRPAIDRVLAPGWFEQAVRDIDTFFQVELPAMAQWQFTPEMAARIGCPVLSVLGGESHTVDPWAEEEHALLQAWMPQTESFVLPGVTHALQLMDPAGMAAGLAAFFARHPMTVTLGT
jgi:pimeloyl-ACP methyl ester carboxylesterase